MCSSWFVFQGGNTSNVVETVLAMKSYYEWKERGALGTWKYGEMWDADKQVPRRSTEIPIRRSLSRMSSGVSLDSFSSEGFGLNPTDVVCDISLLKCEIYMCMQ